VRGEPRHFLYSKVMCWVALDWAIKLAGKLHATDRISSWKTAQDEIWQTVVRDGWSDSAGAFIRACWPPSTRSPTG
jgi:GH15 family glucan-1,4-alpha-glucosidase